MSGTPSGGDTPPTPAPDGSGENWEKVYTPDPSGTDPSTAGPTVSINPPDDLTSGNRDTLANYLSAVTENSIDGNTYPVTSGRTDAVLREDDGSPAMITTGPADPSQEYFMEDWVSDSDLSAAKNAFEEESMSALWEEASPTTTDMETLLNKTGQHGGVNAGLILPNFKSTNDAYEGGVGATDGSQYQDVPSDAPELQKKISSILKTNRFSPSSTSPYLVGGNFSGGQFAAEQDAFGDYDATASDEITMSELIRVAKSMMLRQTGHTLNPSFNPDNFTTAQSRASNTFQSGRQLLDVDDLQPINAYGAPDKPQLASPELLYNDTDGSPLISRKTFGALNSWKEPFQGSNRMAMIAVACDGFIAFMIAGVVISAIIDLIDGSSASPGTSDPTTMKKGEHIPESTRVRVLRQMGVPRTQYSFVRCYINGCVEFLGLSLDPDALPPGMGGSGGGSPWPDWADWWTAATSGITGIAFNVIFSAGYYANVMRVINRDFGRLQSDIAGTTASDVSDVISMFRLIGRMNSYTSFRFFMSLATIGEARLHRKLRRFPLGGSANNPLEKMPDNGRTRIAKSRISASKREMVWRHRSAPALILLPTQIRNAYKVFDMTTTLVDATMTRIGDARRKKLAANPYPLRQRRVRTQSTSRISKFLRESLENELEMEYMPFYFHDLRTNEILSFHAFLEDVKDSYAVKYTDTGGYGRIEPVKIYKGTDRKISITWHMVATSKDDFDSLWFSINKLVSMLYPQWSMGKKVRAGSKKFIMPFSQIPTASPLIRLRVGDVIRSNYSRFNLARLFGMAEARPAARASDGGSAATSVSSDAPFDITYESAQATADAAVADDDYEDYADAIEQMEERVETEPTSAGDTSHGYFVGEVCWLLASPSVGYTTWDRGSGWDTTPPPDATHVEVTPFRTRTSMDDKCEVGERIWVGTADGAANTESGAPNHAMEYRVRYLDRDSFADQWREVSMKGHWHEYIVRQADLAPIYPEYSGSAGAPPQTVTLEEQVSNIHDFFNPANNAIVQSFESAGGRGLAGVINSFDMDWKDAPWETGEIGSRAPTFLKISIGFSPIHDIIPGLDNNGWMRTFNYPVGRIAGGLNTDHYDSASPPTVGVGTPPSSRRAGGPDSGAGTRTEFNREENAAFGSGGGTGETD